MAGEGARDRRAVGDDRQVGVVDTAEFVAVGMDMHQPLWPARRLGHGVSLRRHLAQPRAENDQQIALSRARDDCGMRADAQIAAIAGVVIVEIILAAQRCHDRQIGARGELLEGVLGLGIPARPAEDAQRPRRPREVIEKRLHLMPGGCRADAPRGWQIGDGCALGEHVLGNREHDGPGPSRLREVEGMAQVLGQARCAVDLGHPFCHRREHVAKLDLLKGLALALVARDLSDQHDHGARILKRGVDPDARVAGAGPARDDTDPGAAGQLGVGISHERGPPLLTAGNEAQPVRSGVDGIEQPEKAFARNAEKRVCPVRDQGIGDDLCTAARRLDHLRLL